MNLCFSFLAACTMLLAAPVSAAAAPKPISGKLSQGGYTVIAISAKGEAKSVVAKGGEFKLRPPAGKVDLGLRAKDGTYAGPIVVGKRKQGERAIVGVKAGAKLGKLKVNSAKGYAKPTGKVAKESIDADRWARAKKGVPIGAGNLGLVRSKNTHGGAPGDRDLDGIPDSLDVDLNGNLILNQYDRANSKGAHKARASAKAIDIVPFEDGKFLDTLTHLFLGGADTVNANGGSTDAQIAAADRAHESLGVMWTGIDPGSGELDCGVLVYCSSGGTGRVEVGGATTPVGAPPYPGAPGGAYDPDGDGLGALVNTGQCGIGDNQGEGCLGLFPGATTDELRAGDVLIARGTQNGTPVEFASSVGFVYATYPVVASYDDGQGDAATFSYPRLPMPATVRARPDGQVVLKLTFWRPQRMRIEGESGQGKWMDVGNLIYGTNLASGAGGGSDSFCRQSSYSLVDPKLTALDEPRLRKFGGVTFADSAGDQPSTPANTFTYTLNLTDCLAANGQSMSTSAPTTLQIWAFALGTTQGLYFTQSQVQFQLGS